MIRRGHLYWVDLDKRRPALVVSPDYRNERARDVIVVPITPRLRHVRTRVILRAGEGGLSVASAVNAEWITTAPSFDIGEEIGALGRERMAEVERAIILAIGVVL